MGSMQNELKNSWRILMAEETQECAGYFQLMLTASKILYKGMLERELIHGGIRSP